MECRAERESVNYYTNFTGTMILAFSIMSATLTDSDVLCIRALGLAITLISNVWPGFTIPQDFVA